MPPARLRRPVGRHLVDLDRGPELGGAGAEAEEHALAGAALLDAVEVALDHDVAGPWRRPGPPPARRAAPCPGGRAVSCLAISAPELAAELDVLGRLRLGPGGLGTQLGARRDVARRRPEVLDEDAIGARQLRPVVGLARGDLGRRAPGQGGQGEERQSGASERPHLPDSCGRWPHPRMAPAATAGRGCSPARSRIGARRPAPPHPRASSSRSHKVRRTLTRAQRLSWASTRVQGA